MPNPGYKKGGDEKSPKVPFIVNPPPPLFKQGGGKGEILNKIQNKTKLHLKKTETGSTGGSGGTSPRSATMALGWRAASSRAFPIVGSRGCSGA